MKWKMFDQVDLTEKRAVIDALVAYNDSKAPKEEYKEIERYLKNSDGKVVGGILGYSHWGWLFIKQLWVHENIRGKGAGAMLMGSLESAAAERGCEWVWLDTFDFQALPFYEKLGFEIFSTLEDFPKGHKRIFLKKKIVGSCDNGSAIPSNLRSEK